MFQHRELPTSLLPKSFGNLNYIFKMKKYLTNSAAILALFIGTSLTGCLKDKSFDDGSIQSVHSNDGTPKVIEIGLTGTSSRNYKKITIATSNNDTTVTVFPVSLASSEPATEDINVIITKSDAAVTAYNTSQASVSGFVPLVPVAASAFSFVNAGGVVTIPKGSYNGYLAIKFKPSSFVTPNTSAIGFTISSVDKQGYTISGNLKNAVFAITAR